MKSKLSIPNFPGGEKLQTRCLREAGLSVIRKGSRAAVKDFEQRLTSLK